MFDIKEMENGLAFPQKNFVARYGLFSRKMTAIEQELTTNIGLQSINNGLRCEKNKLKKLSEKDSSKEKSKSRLREIDYISKENYKHLLKDLSEKYVTFFITTKQCYPKIPKRYSIIKMANKTEILAQNEKKFLFQGKIASTKPSPCSYKRKKKCFYKPYYSLEKPTIDSIKTAKRERKDDKKNQKPPNKNFRNNSKRNENNMLLVPASNYIREKTDHQYLMPIIKDGRKISIVKSNSFSGYICNDKEKEENINHTGFSRSNVTHGSFSRRLATPLSCETKVSSVFSDVTDQYIEDLQKKIKEASKISKHQTWRPRSSWRGKQSTKK